MSMVHIWFRDGLLPPECTLGIQIIQYEPHFLVFSVTDFSEAGLRNPSEPTIRWYRNPFVQDALGREGNLGL